MKAYFCAICTWVYEPAAGHPDSGINPGTAWDQVPDKWACPLCGASKDQFFSVK